MVVLTADDGFEESVRATFGASPQIGLDVVKGRLSDRAIRSMSRAPPSSSPIIDAGDEAEMAALERLVTRIGNWPPVVAVTQASTAPSRAA